MRVETLLVHMDTSPEAEARLALAASMARTLNAALIGVAGGETAATDAAQRSSALLAEVAEIEQLLHVAGERFAETAANLDATSWRADYRAPLSYLATNARIADLVIVGPRPARSGLTPLSVVPEDVLMTAGRPVLFAPAGLRTWSGERIVVAWKDGKEARQAVYEALPLLARAQAVAVVALSEEGPSEGLDDIVAYLDAHGVEATPHAGVARFGSVGQAILAFAKDFQADMIVAGAFSRSLGQERVFGGVTLDLLAASPMPVLFAH